MKQRLSREELSPDLFAGLYKNEVFLKTSGFDLKLLELIKYRVSQINGCAYCLDMHHKEAIHMGETELRLHSLAAWRECPYYTDKERAALVYAETLTHANRMEVEDEVYDQLLPHFSQDEIAILTLGIVQINSWNRISKAFRLTPGKYVVGQYN